MSIEARQRTIAEASERTVISDVLPLFESLGVDLEANDNGANPYACVAKTGEGWVDLLREKLFAVSPQGLESDEVFLVFSDPHVGILGGELSLDAAKAVGGEIERRWNIYPLIVQALHDLRAYVGTRDGDDGVIEIHRADYVLRRIKLEEQP